MPAKPRSACDACLEPGRRLRRVDVNDVPYSICGSCWRAFARMARPQRRGERSLEERLFEAASEDDRGWFDRHVGRNHRLREPIGGEKILLTVAPPGRRRLMLVRQIKPGIRLKVAIVWPADLPLFNAERVGVNVWADAAAHCPGLELAEAALREGDSRS